MFYTDVGCLLFPGGTWYNELGSVMKISEIDSVNGSFTGTYCSAVGDATKEYILQGRFDTEGRSLGWVVSYQNEYLNAHSTCTWSGQVQLDSIAQEPIILTTWLLTTQTTPQYDWESTNVGFDTFMQSQPAKEVTQRAKLRCQCSHPQAAS